MTIIIVCSLSVGAPHEAAAQAKLTPNNSDYSAPPAAQQKSQSVLNSYAINLTASAALTTEKDFPEIKNFDSKLKEITAFFSRQQPINPVIVSDNPVIALQLVQSLAARCADQQAPQVLRNKQIFWLDVRAMHKGAKTAIEIENCWRALPMEVKQEKWREL